MLLGRVEALDAETALFGLMQQGVLELLGDTEAEITGEAVHRELTKLLVPGIKGRVKPHAR
jgi:hypothetical protein